MIKAVIFDCFGVLVGKGIWRTYELAGGDLERDGAWFDELIEQDSSGEIDDAFLNAAIAKQLGMSVDDWLAIKNEAEQPNLEVFDYIRTELKPHYKIGFLSNVNKGVIEHKIPAELRALFDIDIRSADVGYQKPDPRIYQLALDRLGVKADEAVFTDDHESYLAGATQLGINTILYKDFDDFRVRLEDLLRDS
jgi:epoxide hydrolase-like predicted phosphatase